MTKLYISVILYVAVSFCFYNKVPSDLEISTLLVRDLNSYDMIYEAYLYSHYI